MRRGRTTESPAQDTSEGAGAPTSARGSPGRCLLDECQECVQMVLALRQHRFARFGTSLTATGTPLFEVPKCKCRVAKHARCSPELSLSLLQACRRGRVVEPVDQICTGRDQLRCGVWGVNRPCVECHPQTGGMALSRLEPTPGGHHPFVPGGSETRLQAMHWMNLGRCEASGHQKFAVCSPFVHLQMGFLSPWGARLPERSPPGREDHGGVEVDEPVREALATR